VRCVDPHTTLTDRQPDFHTQMSSATNSKKRKVLVSFVSANSGETVFLVTKHLHLLYLVTQRCNPLFMRQADDTATAAVAAVQSPTAPILGAKAKSKSTAATKEVPSKTAQAASAITTEAAATSAEPIATKKTKTAAAAVAAAAESDAPVRGKGAKDSEKKVDSVALNRELDSLAPKVTTALAAAAAKQPAKQQKRNPTPHGLHTEAAASSAEGNAKSGAKEAGVVYLGHIPFGFFEAEMRKFFAQFGTVLRIKLARNYKVCSSHCAFLASSITFFMLAIALAFSIILTFFNSFFSDGISVCLLSTRRLHGRVTTRSSSLRTRKWLRSSPKAWTAT
jgi:hypothetical protein